VTIDRTTYRLDERCYSPAVYPKDLIVLHFTAGSTLSGAVAEFRRRADGVSVPYVVDTDGSIAELYPPELWSYHLGMKIEKGKPNPNPNRIHEKRCIGIEIVNVGPLRIKGEHLCWWPPVTQAEPYGSYRTRYCHMREAGRYVEVPDKWRGFAFYAAFPPAQMTAVAELVGLLVEQFEIPFVIPPPEKRLVTDVPWFQKHKGIAAHHHCRPEKYDVGPAFDWSIFE
jgi:N-acetyl-anhydromuramyl-L-alanine amidase AmpD